MMKDEMKKKNEKVFHWIKSHWKTAAVLVALALGGYMAGRLQAPQPVTFPAVREPASDFSLPNTFGQTVRLSDHKGKVVLVDFWATWCLPCLQELPDLKALHRKYENDGFTILGISVDEGGWGIVEPFVQENDVPYPILLAGLDPVEGYPVRGLPTAFLIDRKGEIVRKYVGYKQPGRLEKDVKSLLEREEQDENS